MNKIFNKFLIGLLFVLGVIIVPAYKVEAAITVVVKADGVAANKTVAYNSTVKISWDATGATSCSEGKGRGGTGTYGEFTINSIQATETFTVECSAPAYCSGTYVKEADWNGNTWDGSIQPSVFIMFTMGMVVVVVIVVNVEIWVTEYKMTTEAFPGSNRLVLKREL